MQRARTGGASRVPAVFGEILIQNTDQTRKKTPRERKHWQRGGRVRPTDPTSERRPSDRGTRDGERSGGWSSSRGQPREWYVRWVHPPCYVESISYPVILCYPAHISRATHSYLYSTVAGGGYRTVRLINR